MNTTTEPKAVHTWTVAGFAERVHLIPGEYSRPGATCEKCSACIRYVVTLRNELGETLSVGRDCAVTIAGGPELAAIRRAERAWERAEDERLHGEERRAARAAYDARMRVQAESNRAEFGLLIAGLQTIADSAKVREWLRDRAQFLAEDYLSGHLCTELSDEDMAMFSAALREHYAPPSVFLGALGKRLTVNATLEAIIVIGGDGPSLYGPRYLHKFRTAEGGVLAWFASGAAGAAMSDVGKDFSVTGTVKGHEEYQDVKQTMLTRCKLGDPKAEAPAKKTRAKKVRQEPVSAEELAWVDHNVNREVEA